MSSLTRNSHLIEAPTERTTAWLTARRLRVAGMVSAFLAWEGFFAAVSGQSQFMHRQLVAGLIFVGALFYLQRAIRIGRIGKFELISIGLFVYCFGVSLLSASVFFPKDITEWLFATYLIMPLLALPALRAFKFDVTDVMNGLLVTGLIASIFVVLDQVLHLRVFDVFVRGESAGIARRMVFLKTESACAFMILFAHLVSGIRNKLRTGVALALVAINLVVVTESRLAVAALLIAMMLTVFFALKGGRRTRVAAISFAGLCILGPMLFGKYIEQALSYSNYAADDSSVSWRIKTYDFFYQYFEQTAGLGFGVMSTGAQSNNFLAWAANYAGYYYGNGKYPMGLADIGIYGAMVQFGYLGATAVVGMSLVMSWRLMRLGRGQNVAYFSLGALVLGYLLSPLPMNFFTLDWTVLTGSALWSLAALVPNPKPPATKVLEIAPLPNA